MQKPKLKGTRWSKELEKPIYEKWKKDRTYKFNKKTKKKIYSIDTPPPYINTPVHIGQATTYVLMDMFARYRRMKGQEILFPLGLDKNGLPIEIAAEKKFNVKLTETKREKFLELCKKVLDEAGAESIDTFLRMGIGFNSYSLGKDIGEVYETDSETYRALTQGSFIDLWKRGLIYEDERINNWDPNLQTTLADSEIEYKNIPTTFNDIKFKVKETGKEIIIGTTRPELICTCGAVIYNPEDKRYKHLKNKTAVTPLFEKEVKIIEHPLAEMDKGTGMVMMCSAGDLSDIRFFREMDLDPVIAIEKDGRMNHHAGFLRGLKVKEAREEMIKKLKKKNLLVNQRGAVHRTPVSERSGAEIEFIAMREFYLKQLDYKEELRRLTDKINFYSKESKKILSDWIGAVSIDWPISRRRYYSTEIPLWYSEDGKLIVLPKKRGYVKPWMENPKKDDDVFNLERKKVGRVKDYNKKWIGEQRVFDTWFDSSISPLYILMYNRDDGFFKKAYPCSLRPNGKEIVRTWTYYTILRSFQLTNKAVFEDCWINYHVVDDKGYKMSKSKGNIIDPKEILDKFGAEPFRLWSVMEGNLDKTDFRCSFERIDGAGKTITKLWNVARFISLFDNVNKPKKLEPLDLWIIGELNELVGISDKGYKRYDFHVPVVRLRHFLWETFASNYLELVKRRAYNKDGKFTKKEQDSALFTLHYCLDTILKLLSPVIPLLTYKVFKDLRNKDIHFEKFPKIEKVKKVKFISKDLMDLNSKIWKSKRSKGLSLKSGIKNLVIPKKFESIKKDLMFTHGVKEIKFGKFKVEF